MRAIVQPAILSCCVAYSKQQSEQLPCFSVMRGGRVRQAIRILDQMLRMSNNPTVFVKVAFSRPASRGRAIVTLMVELRGRKSRIRRLGVSRGHEHRFKGATITVTFVKGVGRGDHSSIVGNGRFQRMAMSKPPLMAKDCSCPRPKLRSKPGSRYQPNLCIPDGQNIKSSATSALIESAVASDL